MNIPEIFKRSFWVMVVMIICAVAIFVPGNIMFPNLNYGAMNCTEAFILRCIFVIGAVICALIIKYLFEFIHKSQLDHENNMDALSAIVGELRILVSARDSELESLNIKSNVFCKLYTEYFKSIDSLSKEFFEKNDSCEAVRLTILKNIENEVSKMRTSQFHATLIEWLNLKHNNILSEVSNEINISNRDLEFLALRLCGFSPKSVALIQKLTIGNYYNKWTRLRARLAESGKPRSAELWKLLNEQQRSNT